MVMRKTLRRVMRELGREIFWSFCGWPAQMLAASKQQRSGKTLIALRISQRRIVVGVRPGERF
jgi:hypothetical protein